VSSIGSRVEFAALVFCLEHTLDVQVIEMLQFLFMVYLEVLGQQVCFDLLSFLEKEVFIQKNPDV